MATLPETNILFAPENEWLEHDPFLLGPGLCSGANCQFRFDHFGRFGGSADFENKMK